MDLKFSQTLVVQFWLLKIGKLSEFDLQDTGESTRDPLSQGPVNYSGEPAVLIHYTKNDS